MPERDLLEKPDLQAHHDVAFAYKVGGELFMRAIMRTVHGILRRMNTQYVELTNYIAKQHGRY